MSVHHSSILVPAVLIHGRLVGSSLFLGEPKCGCLLFFTLYIHISIISIIIVMIIGGGCNAVFYSMG